ncbi:MAG: hypothetical protein KAG97_07500, partial [Victivallales bacterium]|nr:hypothetical protein [Victivallales bacterium]
MASDIIINCPKCGEDFEMAASKAISVECPHCSKKVVVPPEFRKKGGGAVVLVVVLFFMVLAGVGGAYYMITTQRVADEKKARIAAARRDRVEVEEAILAKKAEEWVKVLDSTHEEALNAEDDFKRALGVLSAFQESYPKEVGYTSVLKEKLLRLRREKADAVMKSLKKKANSLVDEGKFTEAAAVYGDFSGDFAGDTRERRHDLASECRRKAEAVVRVAAEKERLAKERREVLVKEVVDEMTKQRYEEALVKLRSSKDDSLKELVDALAVLSHISNSVLRSFKDDIGKKVTIRLRQGKLTAKIKKVEDGAIFAVTSKKGAKVSRSIEVKDLDYSEIADRLASRDKLAGMFFKGIVAMKKREYAAAEECFNGTGLLAPDLLRYLRSMRKIAAKAPVIKKKKEPKVLKKLNYKGVIIDLKVSAGKKKTIDAGRIQSFKVRYAVKNMTGADLNNCTLVVYIVGESVVRKNAYKLINQNVIDLNLKNMKKMNS